MKRSVLEYLRRSAARLPEKTAVIDEKESMTYRELLGYSLRIGSEVASRAPSGAPVPVLMEKSAKTLSAFLGIAQAGCFYVLMSPELPRSRLEQIQSVLDAQWVITDEAHRALAEELFAPERVLLVETLLEADVDEALLSRREAQRLDLDPLYANFTSGSTGVPKGVVVGHRSVLDFIDVFTRTFAFREDDVFANQAPFDFDVSVKDIYSSLAVGGTLVIVPRRLFSLPTELLDFLCGHNVTVMVWAVSALCLITTFHGLDYKTPETVRQVLFSGEVMPMKHLKEWMAHLPQTRFVNLYGPTEITCNCTYHIIDRERDYGDVIPMGTAFENEQVLLLDGENRLVTQPEVNGEVCVRGSALALGYYNAWPQTNEHFVQNPLNSHFIEYIYRTGDLAHYNEAGELVFAGRKDFQIKHMGHRIELEEIERAIAAVPGIERACCIFDEKKSKLKGFYVGAVDKKELHHILSEQLPFFMVPGVLTPLEQMPLTKNGKIDRKALAALKRGGRA